MITHYGLFWSERDVFWGKEGGLLGREKTPLGRRGAPTKAERNFAKDYRDFVGIYCLYGDGALLYVGEAGLETQRTLFTRLRDHRKGPIAGRWDRFSWFGRETCDGEAEMKAALAQLEAVTIAIINPGFNKQAGSFARAIQVFQVPHTKADGDVETKLDRLSEAIVRLEKNSKLKSRKKPKSRK
jgi:hypothetical protein